MGLDNGIRFKNRRITEGIPSFVKLDNECFVKSTEVVYFRKFWTWRNEVIEMLHMNPDDYDISLDEDDIEMIARITKKFLNKEYYEEDGDGFGWSYEERFEDILQTYINLLWLRDYKKNHPEVDVRFYDSY